jgi:XTP/dITP diphosphohydrolase
VTSHRGDPAGARRLLVASFNPGKTRELRELLEGAGYDVEGLEATGIREAYEEAGATYEENGLGKARHYARFSGRVTVADDSGLEVEALGGAPGPAAARYGGPGLDDAGRLRRLLQALEQVPEGKRAARYVAVVVVARPDGEARSFRATCEGTIAREARGEGGFGYDPIFFYPPFGMTFGQVSPGKKAGVSHRGKALAALAGFLRSDEGRRFLEGSR